MKIMDIPLCIPNIGEEEINLVKEVLKSGWLAHGPKGKAFEDLLPPPYEVSRGHSFFQVTILFE